MNHTKEPWRITQLDRVIADCMGKVNDDYFIADCFGPDAKANARRIVACVNACSLIPTEWLEENGAYAIPSPSFRDLIKERDQLRELCGELLESLKEYMGSVELINTAMKDGINVHGAISGLAGAEEIALQSITKAEKALGGNDGQN